MNSSLQCPRPALDISGPRFGFELLADSSDQSGDVDCTPDVMGFDMDTAHSQEQLNMQTNVLDTKHKGTFARVTVTRRMTQLSNEQILQTHFLNWLCSQTWDVPLATLTDEAALQPVVTDVMDFPISQTLHI